MYIYVYFSEGMFMYFSQKHLPGCLYCLPSIPNWAAPTACTWSGRALYQGENSTKKSLQMPRQLVCVQPFCWYLASTSSTYKGIWDALWNKQSTLLFLMYLYQRQQSLIYENRNTACIHVQQRPNVRNIQNGQNRVFEKICVTTRQVGFGSFILIPKWWVSRKHTSITNHNYNQTFQHVTNSCNWFGNDAEKNQVR